MCGYKPGPAERAYYIMRQTWREGKGYQGDIVAAYKAMMAERDQNMECGDA